MISDSQMLCKIHPAFFGKLGENPNPMNDYSFPHSKAHLGGTRHFQTHPSLSVVFFTRRFQLLKDVAATPHQCIPTGAFRRIHLPGRGRSWLLIVTVIFF